MTDGFLQTCRANGFAKAPAHIRASWGLMVEEFLREDENLKLTVMIVDARHEPTKLDRVMKQWLEQFSIPFRVVATKVDKLSSHQLQKSLNRMKNVFNCGVIPLFRRHRNGEEGIVANTGEDLSHG